MNKNNALFQLVAAVYAEKVSIPETDEYTNNKLIDDARVQWEYSTAINLPHTVYELGFPARIAFRTNNCG